MLAELLFGNENIDIGAMIRNDNSIVVENVHTVNSVTKNRMINGALGSNRAELGNKPWLSLSRIVGSANISDEMAKATTQNKFIFY